MENQERFMIANRIQTPDGTILWSRHRHDYVEYEDISKYIKDECDKKFGEEFLCIIVDKFAAFGSCLKCAPGSLFMAEYQKYRVIIFRV